MSHDLERAFGDLADAAARAAGRGLLAAPSMEPTLHRIVGTVRRRRAARAVGASGLALALVVGTAGAVNAGWFGGTADSARPVVPATPIPDPVRTGLCGATTAQLEALATALPSLVVTNETANLVGAEDPFGFHVQAGEPFAATEGSSVVLVSHGRAVGAGFVSEPADSGLTDRWDGAAVVYDCSTLDGVTRAGAGDYEMWLVATVTVAGQEPTLVARGPWEITLADSATPGPTSAPSPAAELTACGASDEGLYALDDPFVAAQAVGVTAPPISPVPVDGVPGLTISVDNRSAEDIALATALPRVVLTRDHVIVGGAYFGAGSRGPAGDGESIDFSLTEAVRGCRAGGDALDGDGPALTPGEYGAFVVLTVRPLGTTQDTVAVGGPFALTLTAP